MAACTLLMFLGLLHGSALQLNPSSPHLPLFTEKRSDRKYRTLYLRLTGHAVGNSNGEKQSEALTEEIMVKLFPRQKKIEPHIQEEQQTPSKRNGK